MNEINNLDELLLVLRADRGDDDDLTKRSRLDWTCLPTFGGEEIIEPGVWSWDKTRKIVGSCPHDVEIVAR